MATLEVTGLGISFGGLRAVDDLTMSIEKGGLVGLIGPNGAGKTTVFNMLTGVYRPTDGGIRLNGENLIGKKPYEINRMGVARTFQNIRLFPQQSVLDNVMTGLNNQVQYSLAESLLHVGSYHKKEKEMTERSMEILRVFGLEDSAQTLASNLPYGKQRKLEIARALATKPELLLLDEPAAGMNPNETGELMDTIRLEIHMRAVAGEHSLILAPGNYGERFLKEETGLSMENFIKCSNFIGTSFKMLSQEGIHQALLAGHVGKLVKVAGGVMNTHSRYGDRRMEILSACARTVGFPEADALLPMNTTEEAADFLYEHGYLKQVMEQVANQVKAVLEEESGVQTEVMLFSSNYGLMARTAGADAYVRELLEMERGMEVMIDRIIVNYEKLRFEY